MSEKPVVKVGDEVMLNSGGPAMTIVSVTIDSRKCKCTWYCAGAGTYCSHEFLVSCVKKVDAAGKHDSI